MALWQVVIRYGRPQVMDVMKPDISCKPAQYSGQFKERASL